jgi:hypothetical protein
MIKATFDQERSVTYRNDVPFGERGPYLPGARIDLHDATLGWRLVQLHHDSPHPVVWESEPYPTVEAAEARHRQLRAMWELAAGRDPRWACGSLTHLAFGVHHDRHPERGALGDCDECLEWTANLVLAAIRELQEIAEVRMPKSRHGVPADLLSPSSF